MDIGLTGVFGSSPRRDAGFLREFAIGAEELGFASVWAPDHVVYFPRYESKYPYSPDGSVWFRPDEGIYDPLMVCQAVAAATTTLRVGTGVLIATERHPLVTAKLVMTLDHLSGGRFELGVGSGWSSEEYAALGVPFERRGARLDEYLLAMKAAWADDATTFHGEFVEFDDVVLFPKPLTRPHPPILVGGDSRPALHRAARLGDGWYGWWVGYELEAQLALLGEELAAAGRAGDGTFRIKVGRPPDASPDDMAGRADEARALGVDELVVAAPIRASQLDADLREWAQALGVEP
jgi:probable F420-dependent oxidoreductase